MGTLAERAEIVGASMRGRLAETLARRAELLGAEAASAADVLGAPLEASGSTDIAERTDTRHVWVAQPMHSDAAIRAQTGRSWDDWIDDIDAGVGRDATHPQIVEWVMASSEQNGWWSQGIAVSFERMTGRRLAGQMPDGTFTANRARTLPADRELLRQLIADDDARDALLGLDSEFRSKLASKSYRVLLRCGDESLGALLFTFDATADGRTKLAIMHEKLQVLDEIELWKAHWGDWLDALERALLA